MSRISSFFADFFGGKETIKLNNIALEKPCAELQYMQLAIGIASSIISGALSKCEVKFYYDGELNDKALEHYRWNVRPNSNQNANEFKSAIIESLIRYGDCLVVEQRNELFVAENFTIEKDGVKPFVFTNISINGVSIGRSFKRKDVFYFKLNSFDLTALLNRVYSSYGEILAAAIDSYKAANSSKWKLKVSAAAAAKKDFKEKYMQLTQSNLRTFFENPNAVYPEFEGYELINLTQGTASSGGTEVSEIRKDIFKLVGETYKIPQALMEGENITTDIVVNFLSICIEPIARMITAEITGAYFSYDEWSDGNRAELDTTNISISAISNIAQACEKFIGSGVMNIDEVRERIIGLNALNTELSQKYFVTKNFADIEKDSKGGEENE